jgi:hypothetical protein
MKYVALFVILIGSVLITLSGLTFFYDDFYSKIIGEKYILFEPFITVTTVVGVLNIVGIFVIAYSFDETFKIIVTKEEK